MQSNIIKLFHVLKGDVALTSIVHYQEALLHKYMPKELSKEKHDAGQNGGCGYHILIILSKGVSLCSGE